MAITFQFAPGTIIIPMDDGRIITVIPNDEGRQDILGSAQHYHDRLDTLETAKQRLTNPNNETGNTAIIRDEINEALIALANVTSEALRDLAEDLTNAD